MDAVLTLGQRTAQDEERLEQLRADRQRLVEEQGKLAPEHDRLGRELNRAYERVAQDVVDDLSPAKGIYTSRGNYTIVRVNARLNELRDQLSALQPDELVTKRRLISGGNKEPLPTSGFSLAISDELVATAVRLLATTPVTIVLDSLRIHPEASAWVQEGSRLHRDSDTCAFCGGPLTDDRKAQIEKHFSSAVAQLQRELDDLDRELLRVEAEADSIAQRIPASGLLFDDLRQRSDQAAQTVRDQVLALRTWSAELRDRLSSKRANVLAEVEYDLTQLPAVEGTELAAARDTHNRRVSEHAQLVQAAARDVEIHHLKSGEAQIDDLLDRQTTAGDRLATIGDRLDARGAEITGLETEEGDPSPSAQVLTREVARLLGRNELTFEASGKRYRVVREGRAATGLSVGERTAITLVHFLETVARFDASQGKPIVVIDDPVSSLDSSVCMGISTYIWSAAVSLTKDQVGQLFLLTHNFELFRQWDIQLEGLGNGALKKSFPAELYELRSRHVSVGGTPRRRPVLAKWPESPAVRKKMRSSYHHAFLLMARAHDELLTHDTVENRLDAQLLFPNVIRRVLESFLAFKRPGRTGNFTGAMRETTAMLEHAGYDGDADALRQQLTRFTHAYSHSETPDNSDVVNPDEIASALVSVFSFMRLLDEGHFCGLCESVGVDPQRLAPRAGPVSAGSVRESPPEDGA